MLDSESRIDEKNQTITINISSGAKDSENYIYKLR